MVEGGGRWPSGDRETREEYAVIERGSACGWTARRNIGDHTTDMADLGARRDCAHDDVVDRAGASHRDDRRHRHRSIRGSVAGRGGGSGQRRNCPRAQARYRRRRILHVSAASAWRVLREGHTRGVQAGRAGESARVGRRHDTGRSQAHRRRRLGGRDRPGGDAAGRNRARHPRHHHRPAEDRRAAAERPQLHPARHAHARASSRRRQRSAAAPAMPRRAASAQPRPGFSVNGMRNQSNNFLLDGASNNDTFNTGFVMRPPPDAIQEFKIQTHSYSAEFGRNSGSVVNVVTKGGTNELHGAAWEFNRDDALQARNYLRPCQRREAEAEAEPVRRQCSAGRSSRTGCSGSATTKAIRNTTRQHVRRGRPLGRAARWRFRQHDDPRSAHRAAVPGQSDPGVATESVGAASFSIGSCRAPIPAPTATSPRPTRPTIAIRLGARVDYQLSQQAFAARPLPVRRGPVA